MKCTVCKAPRASLYTCVICKTKLCGCCSVKAKANGKRVCCYSNQDCVNANRQAHKMTLVAA